MRVIQIVISECNCGCKKVEGQLLAFTPEGEDDSNPVELKFATEISRLVAQYVHDHQPQSVISGLNPRGEAIAEEMKNQPKQN